MKPRNRGFFIDRVLIMTFPLANFRTLYPQFISSTDALIELLAEQALCYFSAGCSDACHDQLWMLAVAHMLTLNQRDAAGESQSGAVTSATIDKVSVSFAAPVSTPAAGHWFNLTPFGPQFPALNKRCNGGIKFIGGSRERQAFRKSGGRFR